MSPTVPKTGFLGLSHLGLVSSVGWASLHGDVVGVDTDTATVDSLRRSSLPSIEPGLAELLEQNRNKLLFSTDFSSVADCPLVFISKDVPIIEENESDLTVVYQLAEGVAPHLMQGVTVVLMSQVPVGFSLQLKERIQALRPDLKFDLVYWVETLVIGIALERFCRPERIILGFGDSTKALPPALQSALERFTCPVLKMSYESAELTKMAINLYLCSSVTYTNTLADLCESLGANWWEIVPALRLDGRIGRFAYLRASLGIAGGHLERDIVTLKRLCVESRVDSHFIDALIAHNGVRYNWVHRKLQQHVFDKMGDPLICLWGLAYKKGTDSTKNSVSLRVIADLKGEAQIRAYDPAVKITGSDLGFAIYGDKYEALDGADCLLIMTDWDEFGTLDIGLLRQRMRCPTVIDCVGILTADSARFADINYVSLGNSAV